MKRNLSRLFICVVLIVAASVAAAPGAGAADPQQFVRFSLDDGRVNLGQFKGERLVEHDEPTDPIAQLIAAYDPATGDFAAEPAWLFIPPKAFRNVYAEGFMVDVVASFTAAGPISGNFDFDTGVLDTQALDINADVSIYTAGEGGNEAQLLARCSAGPIPLPFATTGSLVDDSDPLNPVTYQGDPFDSAGAAVETWDSLPATTPAGGPYADIVCPIADEMVGGPGGIWLSGIADLTTTPPTTEPPVPPGATPKTAQPPITGATDKRCKRGKKRVGGRCVKKAKKRRHQRIA